MPDTFDPKGRLRYLIKETALLFLQLLSVYMARLAAVRHTDSLLNPLVLTVKHRLIISALSILRKTSGGGR